MIFFVFLLSADSALAACFVSSSFEYYKLANKKVHEERHQHLNDHGRGRHHSEIPDKQALRPERDNRSQRRDTEKKSELDIPAEFSGLEHEKPVHHPAEDVRDHKPAGSGDRRTDGPGPVRDFNERKTRKTNGPIVRRKAFETCCGKQIETEHLYARGKHTYHAILYELRERTAFVRKKMADTPPPFQSALHFHDRVFYHNFAIMAITGLKTGLFSGQRAICAEATTPSPGPEQTGTT